MKVVFPTCCGVDVHKSFLVATIIKTPENSLQPSYQKKRFSSFNSDLNRFADWLYENDCMDVCMESTGKYWVPVFNILEKREIRVVIANPKWVKAVKGNKDDTKDSKWIGDLFRIGLVKSSFIPDKDIRVLRELTRYRYKLTSMKSSEKNRFQNAFTVCNVALDSVVSDMFGKSAAAITDYLTSDENFNAKHCVSLLQGSLKKKADDVLQSIEGYEITVEQKTRIGIVRDHLRYIDTLIDRVDSCNTKATLCFFVRYPALTAAAQLPFCLRLVLIWRSSALPSACAVGPVLPQATTNLLGRRNLSAFHVRESISNLRWYKLPTQP